MKTHIARSIFDTQARLEQAVTVDHQTRAQGTPWISAHFRDTLAASLAQLRTSSAEHGQVREGFLRAQKQRRSDVDQLARLVRDFFQVLRRRSNRLDQRDAVEALYKRPTRVPQWASVPEWLQWAKNIIQGELHAQAMGYPAMTNPSADEIAEVMARASASEVLWSEHFQQLKIHEQRLREARIQGTRTLRGLAMRLRETLSHEVPATRRELMRTFGFSFISTGAKDRQKQKGPSQLHDLVKALSPVPEDADSAQIEQLATPLAPHIKAPDLSGAPTEKPTPIQAKATHPPLAPASDTSETSPSPLPVLAPEPSPQTRDACLAFTSTTADQPKSKLSRRQKKALRRAQKEGQDTVNRHQEPATPDSALLCA